VLQTKELTPTHYPLIVFTFGLIVEFIKEFEGASNMIIHGQNHVKSLDDINVH
jgi:hypothetical protein